MSKTSTIFVLQTFADEVVARFREIECNGHGDHRRRSRGGLWRRSCERLIREGFTEAAANQVVRDCLELSRLEDAATEDDDE